MPRRGRKEEILAIACRLFSQKGYHGTTIRDISEACGILAGSLYSHINTKEDLLFEITNRGADGFYHSLLPIVESDLPIEQKFRLAVRAHIQVVEDNLEAATVFFHEWKALTGERFAQIQAKRDRYEQLWAAMLDEGIQAGMFRLQDEKFARLLILSVGNWIYQWYRPEGELSAEEIADRFVALMLHGFARE